MVFQISLIIGVAFSAVPSARAAETPLDKIIEFYKGKAQKNEDKKTESKNEDDKKQLSVKKQENKKSQTDFLSKKVPKTVDDPREIEKAAEFAAEKTGVRKDFLMGALVVESNLGRNHGQCSYDEVASGAKQSYENGRLSSRAWKTFQQRQSTIIDLANDLGYDYHQLKVSCNPAGYAGTGGAMGIAQFMPDMWMAYEKEIGQIVGKKNPDPWDVNDAVVAMALLLGDTPGVTEHNQYAERNAAKMYLSGTTSWRYDWYADQIMYWSLRYRELLG